MERKARGIPFGHRTRMARHNAQILFRRLPKTIEGRRAVVASHHGRAERLVHAQRDNTGNFTEVCSFPDDLWAEFMKDCQAEQVDAVATWELEEQMTAGEANELVAAAANVAVAK